MNIATITLNPALDRNILIGEVFEKEKLNLTESVSLNAGGKGINVSRMLKKLGVGSEVYGFCGGRNGKILCDILNEEGIKTYLTETKAETRMNIKLIDSLSTETEINEKGGPVSQTELDSLIKRIENSSADVFVIGGSTPRGLESTTCKIITEILKKRNKRVVTDISGEPLKNVISALPSLIKPNRDEFSYLLGYTPDEDGFIKESCRFYEENGIEVILTLGKKGAVYSGKGGNYRIINPEVKPLGFSGAGDTFLASYLYAESEGMKTEEVLKFASAASLSKVELEGTKLPDMKHIYSNINRVCVKKL